MLSLGDISAQTDPPSGRPPLFQPGRPGPRERPIQVSPRPAGCSRAAVNSTGLRVSSCTKPPRPRHPRHPHPLAGRNSVEAWRQRAEGRGRCRCVRSSPTQQRWAISISAKGGHPTVRLCECQLSGSRATHDGLELTAS